jgi:hypothetical protein
MGRFTGLFASSDGMHQVMRNGDLLTDLSTGKTGFVVSDSDGMALITDQQGRMHQVITTGGMSTDLTTGATYFEI